MSWVVIGWMLTVWSAALRRLEQNCCDDEWWWWWQVCFWWISEYAVELYTTLFLVVRESSFLFYIRNTQQTLDPHACHRYSCFMRLLIYFLCFGSRSASDFFILRRCGVSQISTSSQRLWDLTQLILHPGIPYSAQKMWNTLPGCSSSLTISYELSK